jgi:hypothetical protein
MKPGPPIQRLLLVLLFAFAVQVSRAQSTYMDSLQSWRKNYIGTHELLKTQEERSWLRFYPVTPAYKVEGVFEELTASPWFPMATSGAKPKMARKYGRLTFQLHDTTLHLVVYQMQALLDKEETRNYLFVGFTDATSAVDTYGAGRYIDCETTDIHAGQMVLDFNKAYNPYCAYASGYNCPIPPLENNLPVAIVAGEKNYAKKLH